MYVHCRSNRAINIKCSIGTQKSSRNSTANNLSTYSEVPNRRADQNKRAGLEESDTLLAYLLNRLINEQGGIINFTK